MSQRIDKWLVYARFVKHRSDAQLLVEAGHVRINTARVAKTSQAVRPGDVLTLALHGGVKVIKVTGEPERRGPACDARLHYDVIQPGHEPSAEKKVPSANAIC